MARLIARFLKPGFNHLAFALLFSASSRAAELGPATNATPAFPLAGLTLADAKHLAFLRNWDLLAAKSDVDLATAQRLVVREFPNPTASFSTAKHLAFLRNWDLLAAKSDVDLATAQR